VDSFIRITRQPYEEPYHVNLLVAACNGRMRGALEIYANASDLCTVADELAGFPRRRDHEFVWELGSERPGDEFAFYFRFGVALISATGSCAVQVRLNNNRPSAEREIAEVSIPAEPADIDRLASLFRRFGDLEHTVLEWRVHDGELR
jgi:hypothetical protein